MLSPNQRDKPGAEPTYHRKKGGKEKNISRNGDDKVYVFFHTTIDSRLSGPIKVSRDPDNRKFGWLLLHTPHRNVKK